MKDNLKIKREERRREENPLKTLILVLIRLLIRRGSVLKAKLRMAKRLGKARAMTIIYNNLKNVKMLPLRLTFKIIITTLRFIFNFHLTYY
jgi:hypothetical protein